MSEQLQLVSVMYKANSYIIVEGKLNADRFFIIMKGKVRLSREVEVVADQGGNILGPGDVFGVVAAMSSHSSVETAMALTDVNLISVKKEQYEDLIRQNTPVAMKIIRQFSQRLRYLDEAFSRRTMKAGAENSPSCLFALGEYYTSQHRYNHAFYAYQQYILHCPNDRDAEEAKNSMKKIAPYVQVIKPKYDSAAVERSYPKDCLIFAEGETGDELYIIKSGSVTISKVQDNQEIVLAVLKKGDIFGEMTLLEQKPRTATAAVYEDCTVLAVNRANFEGMISGQSQFVARLTTLFAERIWMIYRQLANTKITNPVGRLYDALQIQLEKDHVSFQTGQSHLCHFGFQELVGMAGLPLEESGLLLKKILLSKRIAITGGKILVKDSSEVVRQVEYYRQMQKMGITRGDAS